MNGTFVNPNIATLGFTVRPFTPTYGYPGSTGRMDIFKPKDFNI